MENAENIIGRTLNDPLILNILVLLLINMSGFFCMRHQEEEKIPAAPFRRIVKMNAPEWPYIFLGCCSSLINGGMQPAFAIIFSEYLGVSVCF